MQTTTDNFTPEAAQTFLNTLPVELIRVRAVQQQETEIRR